MRANEVSIVLCANCGHEHPLGICPHQIIEGELYAEITEVCGCTQWEPILKPFAHATPKPPIEREHWIWKVVAWAALIALFVWITYGGGQ